MLASIYAVLDMASLPGKNSAFFGVRFFGSVLPCTVKELSSVDYRPLLTGPLSKALKSYGVVPVARFSVIAAFAVFRSLFLYYCVPF